MDPFLATAIVASVVATISILIYSAKSSQSDAAGQPVLRGEVPAAPQIVAAALDPENQRRRLILDRTAALSSKDKGELSAVLRELSQVFNQADTLVESLQQYKNQLRRERNQGGAVVKNLESHFQFNKQMIANAAEFEAKMSGYFRGQYFDQQLIYILGNDPNKILTPKSEVHLLDEFLSRWSTVQNKEDQTIQYLLDPSISRFSDHIDQFQSWLSGCKARLADIKSVIL